MVESGCVELGGVLALEVTQTVTVRVTRCSKNPNYAVPERYQLMILLLLVVTVELLLLVPF
jgi:hypothetical protein